ncbi:TIGR03032 family protein [Sphingopyxis fribergensis]|uniref:TIGR03032 family protein n=1 Tax=Sphingopyxis fribergensis TaxID=1515612 RepID=A0A0A7PKR6_9SPHN|nr:TIGR03032 family protein [Sphingopyxis fribergensis]AJA08537.1 TIGR03032 family protein [Sphingopyxis fribergensis]
MTDDISASRGLAGWLRDNRLSFACTSYQTGLLVLVGSHPEGAVAVSRCAFDRAMGLAWRPGRLYLAGRREIWRLENILPPGEQDDAGHDAVFVPRNAQITGDLDIHEMGVTRGGQIVFVNTAYSCLATPSIRHSFRPLWKPDFISRLTPEDRCHLNGVAFGADGEPAFVTAAGRSDIVGGWRDQRRDGGLIIDVATGATVADGLSMPHSPRLVGRNLFFLESGRGQIVRFNLDTSERRDVAFCPGFLRGLSIHNGHALVTLSKPREETFAGLPIDKQISIGGGTPWCGVMVVELASGNIIEWLRFHGPQSELFDIVAMPEILCPSAVAPRSAEADRMLTFDSLPVLAVRALGEMA